MNLIDKILSEATDKVVLKEETRNPAAKLKSYEPIFTMNGLNDISLAGESLEKMLATGEQYYQESVADIPNKLERKLKGSKTGVLSKYDQARFDAINKKTKLAYELIQTYVIYAKQYNERFNNVKEALTSTDHNKTKEAIYNLLHGDWDNDQTNYRHVSELAKNLNSLKTYWKSDKPLIDVAEKCFKLAQANRETLKQALKYLFKTPAQIEGFRKLASAMRSRWGSY